MTWLEHHKISELAAEEAHRLRRQGHLTAAIQAFEKAASAEEIALSYLSAQTKPKTYSITAVSTAALWFKAEHLQKAEYIAHKALSEKNISSFATDQLRAILQSIWNRHVQQETDIKFIPGQITVSVDGGEVVRGGAPLDLIVEKVQTIQSIFYRTAEFLQKLPARKLGPAPKQIQEMCRPWLFQSVPGSYQFTVAIEGSTQLDLFNSETISPSVVASTFLAILASAASDPEQELLETVSDPEYRNTFLKLARNLAPDGKKFEKLSISSTHEDTKVLLTPSTRKDFSNAIRKFKSPDGGNASELTKFKGILRAVHLDKDWIELSHQGKTVLINDIGDNVDDFIGPMVNHEVEVIANKKNGKYYFIDIERQ